MSKQKQDKQGGGWQFPRPLEIIKCKEGNKEYMKERPRRASLTEGSSRCANSALKPSQSLATTTRGRCGGWQSGRRRDFLRVSWINTAIVTAAKTDRPYMAVIVYGKY